MKKETTQDSHRYKRHYVHNYILAPYHKLTVNVIGCGGTGSQVLTALGRMSYALNKRGHPGLFVTAYDGDIVTESNCGRQLFSEQEIGFNKAEVLISKLNFFFGTKWDSVSDYYKLDSKSANITITCVDTAKARLLVRYSLEKNGHAYHDDEYRTYYWLDMGNLADRGQVVLGTAPKCKVDQPKKRKDCVSVLSDVTELFDLKSIKEKDQGPSCSLAEALSKQDLFINSSIANAGMAILWKMFTVGYLDTQGVFLNLSTMRMNPISIKEKLLRYRVYFNDCYDSLDEVTAWLKKHGLSNIEIRKSNVFHGYSVPNMEFDIETSEDQMDAYKLELQKLLESCQVDCLVTE